MGAVKCLATVPSVLNLLSNSNPSSSSIVNALILKNSKRMKKKKPNDNKEEKEEENISGEESLLEKGATNSGLESRILNSFPGREGTLDSILNTDIISAMGGHAAAIADLDSLSNDAKHEQIIIEALNKVLVVGNTLSAQNHLHTSDSEHGDSIFNHHIVAKQLQIIGEEVLEPTIWKFVTNVKQVLELFDDVCRGLEKILLEMSWDDYNALIDVSFKRYTVVDDDSVTNSKSLEKPVTYADIFHTASTNWGRLEYKTRLNICPKIFVMFFDHDITYEAGGGRLDLSNQISDEDGSAKLPDDVLRQGNQYYRNLKPLEADVKFTNQVSDEDGSAKLPDGVVRQGDEYYLDGKQLEKGLKYTSEGKKWFSGGVEVQQANYLSSDDGSGGVTLPAA